MIRTFLMLLIVFSMSTSIAQTNNTKSNLRPYASLGVSIGHVDPSDESINNFNKASYPSIELGIMGENLSVGAVFGCENFFVNSNSRGFYELKTSLSKPLGKFGIYGLFGVGAYFEKEFNNFIEYGAGFSYMPDKIGCFVQFSNWARTNYISTGISYAL